METPAISRSGLVHCKCSFCGHAHYTHEENLIPEGNDIKMRCEDCGNLFYV